MILLTLKLCLDRIFQELERNAQSKCDNDEAVENKTGEETGSCEVTKELSDKVPRVPWSFSGKYNQVRHGALTKTMSPNFFLMCEQSMS